MQIIQGNIWNFHNREVLNKKSYIIIPTNLGFTKDKSNVMGRGLALECKNKFPEIPKIYGDFCYKRVVENIKEQLFILENYKMIMFPTKKIILEAPHLSWKQMSDFNTIEKSLTELINWEKFNESIIYIPFVGAGNGSLKKYDVKKVLEKYLSNKNNVYVVDYEK